MKCGIPNGPGRVLATVEGVPTVKALRLVQPVTGLAIKEQTAARLVVPREGPFALISGTVQRLPTKGKAGNRAGFGSGCK